jgi:uncharacterized protein with PQ loop repeat
VSTGELLGWIGTVLFLVRLLPQPWHTWRSGRGEGVSVQSLVNGMASDGGWLVYGLVAGLPPVWVAALVAAPVCTTTLVLLREQVRAREVGVAVGWAGCMALGWLVGGPVGLGSVLGVAVVVNHGPQAVHALRSDDLSGLHPATFWLSLADASLWGGYGVAIGDGALVTYGVVLGTVGVIVLVRLARTRVPAAPAPASAAVAVAEADAFA